MNAALEMTQILNSAPWRAADGHEMYFENIGNVRQTRYDSLLLPSRGRGGRWTTDAWTELSGFTVNGGVRFSLR